MSKKILLIIDYSTNWFTIFKKPKLSNGDLVEVHQTQWKNITVQSSSEEGTVCFLKEEQYPHPFSNQKADRIVKPDFILIRNFPTDLHDKDYKNTLIGLMFGKIPAVNTLNSVFMCTFRPLLYSELLSVKQKIDEELKDNEDIENSINVIPMQYFPNNTTESISRKLLENSPESSKFPSVIKVSDTHSGYGKMKIKNEGDYDDLKCILALKTDYFTKEPFISIDYEYRIQKIGNNYRCFGRNSSTSWKNNWGNLKFTDYEVKPIHKIWADKCSEIFGGMDIIGIDVAHLSDGTDMVLELNDSSIGLMYEHTEEDTNYIKEIVLQRMEEEFCGSNSESENNNNNE